MIAFESTITFYMRCDLTEYSLLGVFRECHGSLIEMKASEYQKLWLSEGGGQATPGYTEVLVPVHPYQGNGWCVGGPFTIQSCKN